MTCPSGLNKDRVALRARLIGCLRRVGALIDLHAPLKTRILFGSLLVLVAAGALAFRVPRLGQRPMHADEAVQAARSRDLRWGGRYVYDPSEFHGPTLQYATLPALWMSGSASFAETTEATHRIVPVLFGVGLVVLLGLLADALGRPATLCAALLTALSPAMVFYSRYYIHETLLVFFTLAAIAAGWRYVRSGRLGWCLAAGACLGLMQATKETSAIAFLAMGTALGLAAAWERLLRGTPLRSRRSPPRWHLLLALGAAAVVAITLLSSFFTNLRGPLDGVLAYVPWLSRAGGQSPHNHPACYYLHVLTWWRVGRGPLWSEGLILALAAVGFAAAMRPKGALPPGTSAPFVRWLGCYTVVLTTIYSAIPYKTPWCLLSFLDGMILLAGVGAASLVRAAPTLPLKGLTGIVLLVAAGHLAWQSHHASYVRFAGPTNPYAYAHPRPDVQRLANDVEALARAAPEGHGLPVKVIWPDAYYWPLPWYLRKFEHVELWT
ncbi:MAG: flippase activity-associated protein Agl23, partial [Planctomycetota bacterium]